VDYSWDIFWAALLRDAVYIAKARSRLILSHLNREMGHVVVQICEKSNTLVISSRSFVASSFLVGISIPSPVSWHFMDFDTYF
jgi:hypothetical protein